MPVTSRCLAFDPSRRTNCYLIESIRSDLKLTSFHWFDYGSVAYFKQRTTSMYEISHWFTDSCKSPVFYVSGCVVGFRNQLQNFVVKLQLWQKSLHRLSVIDKIWTSHNLLWKLTSTCKERKRPIVRLLFGAASKKQCEQSRICTCSRQYMQAGHDHPNPNCHLCGHTLKCLGNRVVTDCSNAL